MFDTLSDDLLTNTLSYCTVSEMFAMFCINKEHYNRSQGVLDRRYKSLNIQRYNLHRFHHAVHIALIVLWSDTPRRRASKRQKYSLTKRR